MRFITLFLLVGCLSAQALAQQVSVLTQHNDPGRTGANLSETVLTPSTVQPGKFGKLYSLPADGQIYAQPLIVAGVNITGKGVLNVLYVVTMRNNVYAFDADAKAASDPLWHVNLGNPMPYDKIPQGPQTLFGLFGGTYNIKPWIGITSTPVVDPTANRIYMVAKIVEDGVRYVNRIHVIDIRNGTILARTDVKFPIEGDPSDLARAHLQRPGLLLSNGMIYAAFGSHQDGIPYHGWVVAFDANSLQQKYAFCTTCGGLSGMGGIWQSGNGPVGDSSGNIYFMTGNGDFDPNDSRYGDSFVKLSSDLTQPQWFAPADVTKLNLFDIDLGSAGPMLLPDKPWLVGGGKEGKLYLVDTKAPGGKERSHKNPPIQSFQAAAPWRFNFCNIFAWIPFIGVVYGYHHIHGSPVFWNTTLPDGRPGAYIYIWAEDDNLRAFRYDSNATPPGRPIDTHPIKGMKDAKKGMPGGFLSISANKQKDGIVWAAMPLDEDSYVTDARGSMRAFKATPQNNELQSLWCSDTEESTDEFNFAKFVPPTVANGRVYLATFSERLNVYGLFDQPTPAAGHPPCRASKRVSTAKVRAKPVPNRKHRRQTRG